MSTITAPDGGQTSYYFFNASPINNIDDRAGLVWKIVQPDKTIQRFWNVNNPYGAPTTYHNFNNPYINAEYITINGKTSARAFQYDKNGNMTSLNECDFGVTIPCNGQAPCGVPSGSPSRTTLTSYWFPVAAASTVPTPDPNTYAYAPPSRFRSALRAQEVRAGTSTAPRQSRTEYAYLYLNGFAESLEVESERHWDSSRATLSNCPDLSSAPLTTCLDGTNSSISHYNYDSYGNRTFEIDPNGSQTCYVYDPNSQVPGWPYSSAGTLLIEIDRACGNAQQQEITRFTRNIYTGLVTTMTDPNNVVTTFTYDGAGRPTLVKEASGLAPYERQTSTRYATQSRFVVTRRDLDTTGDGKMITIQHFDPLGRLWRTRQIETGFVPADNDRDSGIKVDTQYQLNGFGRYQLVSNPYRQSGDSTMGWTMINLDTAERPLETWSTNGPTPPVRGGSNPQGNTGVVLTGYDQSDGLVPNQLVTVTTDQRGRVTKHGFDGLGRMRSAIQYPDGIASTTTYEYDAADNLISVSQPGGATRTFVYDSLGRLLRVRNPESGPLGRSKTYQYDANGNVKTKTDERLRTTNYFYDAMNRLTSKTYSDGTPAVTYGYSAVPYSRGRLTSVSSGVSTTSYSATNYTAYDPLGRVTASSQTTYSLGQNQQYSFPNYTYNLAGGLKSVQYPSGRVVTTSYDNLNRPNGVTGYASAITYAAHGAIQQMNLGTAGLSETRTYNNRLQTESVTAIKGTALLTLGYSYGYPNDGSPQSHTISGSAVNGSFTQNYTYDALNRLSAANEGGWSQTYVYDARGNRALLGTSNMVNSTYTPQTPNTASVPYDQYNRWAPGITISYDENGNQTQVSTRSFTYDAEDRVATAADSGHSGTYTYDVEGRRVQRVADGVTTVYAYDAFGQLAAEYSTAGAGFSGPRYLVSDPLGSIRLVTDASGTPVSTHDYLPFGEEIPAVWGARGSVYGVADGVSQRLTGQERDTETGLDFMEARYFSGAQGRFTGPDEPLADQWTDDPQSWNLYNYSRNNPLKWVDTTGRKCVNLDTGGQGDDGLPGPACGTEAGLDLTHGVTVNDSGDYLFGVFGNAVARGDINLTGRKDAVHDPVPGAIVSAQSVIGDAHLAIMFGRLGASITRYGIWTATKKLTSVQNAYRHWKAHGKQFPNLANAKQYVEAAKNFTKNPPPGTLSKVRSNGDKIFYNPSSNTFAVTDSTGVPRTMFKPDPAVHGFPTNLDYFNAQ